IWYIVGNIQADGSRLMKSTCSFAAGRRRFPQTAYFFHSGFGEWRGYASPDDGDSRSEFRNFYHLRRELRIEAACERAKEMAVFALIVATSAWPVIYMVVTVVKLLNKGRP